MTTAPHEPSIAADDARPLDAQMFRRAGHALIDWIADYRENLASRPVAQLPEPGAIRAMLPERAPERGEPIDAILGDLDRVVMRGIVHWQHPGWFAYFPANSSYESILGELASAGLGVQGMLWSTSPACTEIETHVLDWLVHALGLPERFLSSGAGGGVLQDTASSAALVALVAARERATGFASDSHGLARAAETGVAPLVAYTSDQAHSSIEKAVRLAGLGREFLRLVPVDSNGAMRADILAAEIARDSAKGLVPAFVSATVGTTGVNGIDPVIEIARVCEAARDASTGRRPWLHVDAAMSGTAAFCEEFRFVVAGADAADSWCFNPHKWMPVNFDCDALWVADRAELVRALSVLPEYLRNSATESGKVIDYRDWQIPLGRRFRALKLWFAMRSFGLEGLRAMVRGHVSLARLLADSAAAHPSLRLVVDPPLNLVALAHVEGDAATQALIDAVNRDGRFLVSHCRFHGDLVLRVSIGALATDASHVAALRTLLEREATRIAREVRGARA
jgi:aromatic-L-amino-acid decarboxylase